MPPCVAEQRGESNDDDDVAHLTRLESVSITSLLRILHVDRPEHQVRARRQRCLRCVRCGRGTRRSAPRGWPLPVFEIAPTAPVAALRHQVQTRSFLPHVKLTDSIKPDSSYFTDSPATLSSPQLSSAHRPSSIKIYVEGGGDGRNGRAALRRGMDAFLGEQKRAATDRGWSGRLICASSRNNLPSAG